MKKTGIMGGSFNPIHTGHLEIAECAWREYGLDEILFIPNYCPPHKDSSEMLDPKSRLDMVKLAIQGHPHYTVTDREIQKRRVKLHLSDHDRIKNRRWKDRNTL